MVRPDLSERMYALLEYLYAEKGEHRPVPKGTSRITVSSLHTRGYILKDTEGWYKISARGLIAYRTAKSNREKGAAVVEEVVIVQGEGKKKRGKQKAAMAAAVMDEGANLPDVVEALGCGECVECYAGTLLERLQALDPRIKKVIEAWAMAKNAERELMG